MRPSEDDFNRILDRLKAQGDKKTLRISPTILDEGNETKQEKHERLRQEALQRDQYILSMRPNRHVVFAAKFAKIKNQGLTKRFEKQVHTWSQEMERNFRLVGANEKALEKELQQGTRKEKRHTIPYLHTTEKSEIPEGYVKRQSIKLPKLYRKRTHRAKRANKTEQGLMKGDVHAKSDEIEFSDTSVRLPPIGTEKNGGSHIE
ncbi:hypothetical protein ACROYT_G036821 [Oculina patagonica]